MLDPSAQSDLPPIPGKRYFTIGEVSKLCNVKPHVLRYWEQEFTQLKPVKRRGNRRYYQRHEVQLIRDIRQLLYFEGFTIAGACKKLSEDESSSKKKKSPSKQKAIDKRSIDVVSQSVAELNELIDYLGR
ncbi:MAG: MerR family transcriptional regulator [Arenicellales bacterium]|nr:transcriptional regulator [Acidiferrobacteraceae bacterium]MDP6123674.1 MerR family transcriptional regulator [Arenicellales bacterium]MBT58568.1 transcriptional regulator [Acidiferrobacteraceae bacterium]MDP6290176.1 MerR family transcriptional regulator [Arenicellales bacterium]MDP6435524.1 MerR family transcriptional regulator [Arenicellales bacterium]